MNKIKWLLGNFLPRLWIGMNKTLNYRIECVNRKIQRNNFVSNNIFLVYNVTIG